MTATTDALADFLLARIAEDEARARAAADVAPSPWEVADRGWMASLYCDGSDQRLLVLDQDQCPGRKVPGDVLRLIEWFDPARVLAECEAKRQIVGLHLDSNRDLRWDGDPDPLEGYCELCHDYSKHQPEDWPCRTMRLLALPYSGRPDYRKEWRP